MLLFGNPVPEKICYYHVEYTIYLANPLMSAAVISEVRNILRKNVILTKTYFSAIDLSVMTILN